MRKRDWIAITGVYIRDEFRREPCVLHAALRGTDMLGANSLTLEELEQPALQSSTRLPSIGFAVSGSVGRAPGGYEAVLKARLAADLLKFRHRGLLIGGSPISGHMPLSLGKSYMSLEISLAIAYAR
jgi:hypothetical protein